MNKPIKTLRLSRMVVREFYDSIKDFAIGVGMGLFLLFFWAWFGDHETA